MFVTAFYTCFQVRRRSRDERLDPELQRFMWNTANGLIVSMGTFVVGGSFLSLALNDVTWLTFGMVGALGFLAARPIEATVLEETLQPRPALAFRAVEAYRIPGAHA
jgi:hypothetical protein